MVWRVDPLYYTSIIFDDGIRLDMPENNVSDIEFHITSDKYLMVLAKGKTIQVGMKADELKSIFSKSYSKRIFVDDIKGINGKVRIYVYYSRKITIKFELRMLTLFSN